MKLKNQKDLHITEGICSALVVGLGQIIKGNSQKGILLMLFFYFVLPALVYSTLLINIHLFLFAFGFAVISGIITWMYAVGEALLK
jgi:hypothetical protein